MRRNIARTSALILVIITVFLTIYLPLRPQPALLTRAVRVATAPSGYDLDQTYQWVSPNEVLAIFKSNNFDNMEHGFQAARIRTDTGAISFLQHNNAVTKNAFHWEFSPDGRWYLCSTMGEHRFDYYLCAADDSKRYKVHTEISEGIPCQPFAWLGDSQHWVSMPGFDTDPVEVRMLLQAGGPRVAVPLTFGSCSFILSSDRKHTIIRDCNSETRVKTLEIGIWNLEVPAKNQIFSVPLPRPAEVIDIAVSPTGEHLAWLLHVREEATAYNLARHLLRFLRPSKPHDTYQIWTSTLKGSTPKLIGAKPITAEWRQGSSFPNSWHHIPAGWKYTGGVYNLRWAGDEKKLSFTYNDSLYTLAIQ